MKFRKIAISTFVLFTWLQFSAPLFSEDSAFNKYYNNAEKLSREKRYAESVVEIDKALAVAGNDDEKIKTLRYKYYNIFFKLRNYSEAAKISIEVLNREHLPDKLKEEWFHNLVNAYTQAGKRDEAIAECDKYITSLSPILKNAAYQRKYNIRYYKKDFDDALNVADNALKQENFTDEQKKNWIYQRLNAYNEAGRFDDALVECDKLILSPNPEIREIGFNYKYSFYSNRGLKNDKENALKIVDSALADKGFNEERKAQWLLNRIYICYDLKKMDELITDCDKLLDLPNPRRIDILSLKFRYCCEIGNYELALKVTDEALLKNKDDIASTNRWFDSRIQAYIHAKWFDEAIADIDKYKSEPEKLQLKKRVYAAQYKFYQERKDYENALKTTDEALKLKGLTYDENNQWHTNQINTYIAAGKFNEAIAEIKKLMSQSGAFYERTCIALLENTYSAQREYYQRNRMIDDAIKVIDDMLVSNCFNNELKAEWLLDRARMLLNVKRYDEAIADADRLIVFNSPLFIRGAYSAKIESYLYKKDYEIALKIVDEAAKQMSGSPKEQWNDYRSKIHLAWGEDLEAQDKTDEARKQFETAGKGNAGAEEKLEELNAYVQYRKAAEQGDANAQFELGLCYVHGKCVTKNQGEAVKWWHKGAEQGNKNAQFWLGVCYNLGYSVVKDSAEALKWWQKAAAQGHENAQECLIAERGDAKAQTSLGYWYADIENMDGSQAEAVKWYRKAAEQGYADAQFELGRCYSKGLGVAKDNAEAVKWYRKAADQDLPRAKAAFERLKNNIEE